MCTFRKYLLKKGYYCNIDSATTIIRLTCYCYVTLYSSKKTKRQ